MKANLAFFAAIAVACSATPMTAPGGGNQTQEQAPAPSEAPRAGPHASGPKPSWVDRKAFTAANAASIRVYGIGERTIHVLVGAPLGPTTKVSVRADVVPPTGGLAPEALVDALREANRAALDATGACSDPYKRKDLSCCGPIEMFCSDPKRFNVRGPNETCGCGGGPPCLFDFSCVAKAGAHQCECSGTKCPCEGLLCDRGETCGDGRCY